MSTNTITLIALAAACLLALTLILLYMKKVIKKETVESMADMVRDLPVTMGSGLFGKIYEYSRTAVLTVEQLVKIGQIEPDNASRKAAAMEIVEKAAVCDDVPFLSIEREVADACIEAQVHQLPRNQQTVSGGADA